MIPIQFEYIDTSYTFGCPIEIRKFVVVLDMFRHHYNGKLMYHIRVDFMSPMGGPAVSEYLTYDEAHMLDILKTRVTDV